MDEHQCENVVQTEVVICPEEESLPWQQKKDILHLLNNGMHHHQFLKKQALQMAIQPCRHHQLGK